MKYLYFGASAVSKNNGKYFRIKNVIEKQYPCMVPYLQALFCEKMCLYTLNIFLCLGVLHVYFLGYLWYYRIMENIFQSKT